MGPHPAETSSSTLPIAHGLDPVCAAVLFSRMADMRDQAGVECDICGKRFSTRSHMRQHKEYKHHLPPDKATALDGVAGAMVVVGSSSKGELLVLSNCCRAVNRSVNVMPCNESMQALKRAVMQMVSQLYQAVAVCVAPHLIGNRDATMVVLYVLSAVVLSSHYS